MSARVTREEVIGAVGWLAGMDDQIQFDSASRRDGAMVLEGYVHLDYGRHYISATFTLTGLSIDEFPVDVWDDEDWGESDGA